jgi:predicted GIY-YIG superfamily endonuclease
MIIYKITNKNNGLVYIGYTVRSLKEHYKHNVGYKFAYLKKGLI